MNTTWALPQVDETRCTLCGLCVEACPCHGVKLEEQRPVFACPETCLHTPTCAEAPDCNCLCEEVCPTGAISCAFEIVLEA
jgi:NAD-dependent dihydropyrimidine dehydrogenase PreA subunit